MLEQVELFEEAEEPVVVFSCHKEPIEELATRPGWAIITGDTPNAQRTTIVEAFQAGRLKGIGGTQAISEGLTITKASNMVFVDRPWTPALGSQTEDRIHRMGQESSSVLIWDLVLNHTIDRMLYRLLCHKEALIGASVEQATGNGLQRAVAADLEVAAPRPRKDAQVRPAPNPNEWAGLFEMFDTARETLKYPKIRMVTADGSPFLLAFAGEQSRYKGNAVHVSKSGYGSDYYGRLCRDGSYTVKRQDILDAVRAFQCDPAGVAKAYGVEFDHCCFCGKELTHPNSLAAGYGPICAGKYGLPWGGN